MVVFFLDDNDECNVRYIVIMDITLFSYLVYQPPLILRVDKSTVKSADLFHPKLNILYQNTKKLNKQSTYISRHIEGVYGCKQNLVKSVVSYCLFPVNYCT